MTLALAAPTASLASDPPSCDRCALPDGSLRLSPAGARKCLADEEEAARARAALAASAEATAALNAARGSLAESRLVAEREREARRVAEEEAREADARAKLLQAQLDDSRRARWYVGAAGVAIGITITILVGSAID